MPSRDALEIATRDGAEVLGCDEYKQIAVDKRMDIATRVVSGIYSVGSWDVAVILLLGLKSV